MPTVRINEVQHVPEAAAQLAGLAGEVLETLYQQLGAFVGRTLEIGRHVEILSVEGHTVTVDFFVDTDGSLWIERVRPEK